MSIDFPEDKKYIKRCFTLAKKGKGKVSPNPLVGSVIVKNGKVIGEGYHRKYGNAHAEVMAFKNAMTDVEGAVLYTNLEPCCHMKKNTPPCVPLIISKKIKRVVISNLDPNPDVSGRGIKQLQNAGIEVTTNVRADEGSELNKFYFRYMKTRTPYVILKIAQSMDGKIGFNNQEQKWLTGEESIKFVHRMRAECDAVLVGSNTVKVDNPHLSVRAVKGRDPLRIIIDDKLRMPLESVIFQPDVAQQTILFTTYESDDNKIEQLEKQGVRIEQFSSDNGLISLKSILMRLGERKIMSLFVEGGQRIFSQFVDKNLFDEILILQAPVILGEGLSPFINEYKKKLNVISVSQLGNDLKILLRKD